MAASYRTLVAAVTVAALAAAGCMARGGRPAPEVVGPPAVVASTGEGSLFGRPWTWTDETGAAVRFEAWQGAPIIVTMIFTDCTSACPLTIERLRRASAALAREKKVTTFVLVTLDPRNDTPDRLRRFKVSRQLPPEWHLLRGGDAETRELADLLQIHVVDNAHIFHDSRIVLFDGDGRLAGQLRG